MSETGYQTISSLTLFFLSISFVIFSFPTSVHVKYYLLSGLWNQAIKKLQWLSFRSHEFTSWFHYVVLTEMPTLPLLNTSASQSVKPAYCFSFSLAGPFLFLLLPLLSQVTVMAGHFLQTKLLITKFSNYCNQSSQCWYFKEQWRYVWDITIKIRITFLHYI